MGPVVAVGVPNVGRLLRAAHGDLAPSFSLIFLAEDGKLGGTTGFVSCDNADELLSMRRLRTATGPDGCTYLDGAPAFDAVDPARLAIVDDAGGPNGAALSTPLARLTVRYARSSSLVPTASQLSSPLCGSLRFNSLVTSIGAVSGAGLRPRVFGRVTSAT